MPNFLNLNTSSSIQIINWRQKMSSFQISLAVTKPLGKALGHTELGKYWISSHYHLHHTRATTHCEPESLFGNSFLFSYYFCTTKKVTLINYIWTTRSGCKDEVPASKCPPKWVPSSHSSQQEGQVRPGEAKLLHCRHFLLDICGYCHHRASLQRLWGGIRQDEYPKEHPKKRRIARSSVCCPNWPVEAGSLGISPHLWVLPRTKWSSKDDHFKYWKSPHHRHLL